MLIPEFDNSFARLPEVFFARQAPVPVANPALVCLNHAVAKQIGFDAKFLTSPDGIALLAGNHVPGDAAPLAMAYAGHQFGGWVPQLGDGRAILLGEVLESGGTRFDVQLKGAGRTPFSRGGDGRAWLGPVMREYLLSEAMHALGVPTTRALAAVTTGETVYRESALPGAVLVRIARSHIRVGTFEYFLGRGMQDELQTLLDYAIARFYPDIADADNKAIAFLDAVSERTAQLIAKWQCIGFIHGVMNTDNMNVSGETIDYGPCAFMDEYSAGKVFSSIDVKGRYAYRNQPGIAQWNMAVLAQCLLSQINEDQELAVAAAQKSIDAFPARYESYYQVGMAKKLGVDLNENPPRAQPISDLSNELFELMERGNADFPLTFRHLAELAAAQIRIDQVKTQDNLNQQQQSALNDFLSQFHSNANLQNELIEWTVHWMSSLPEDTAKRQHAVTGMLASNPTIIPRNHQIEQAIAAGCDENYAPFLELLDAVKNPYSDDPRFADYRLPPEADQRVTQTFCGT